eukprot:g14499.t1 g14499   contig9:1964197-1964766(-)
MMNKVLAIAAIAGSTSAVKTTPAMAENLAKIQAEGIAADSSFGQHLLSKSRRVEQNNYGQQYDMSFVSNYSIKFLGCHHVTQWNSDADEDNNNDQNQEAMSLSNSRIQSKGLVRFRLCPSNSCHDGFSTGCSKDYGEYVVDMVQFSRFMLPINRRSRNTSALPTVTLATRTVMSLPTRTATAPATRSTE